MTKKRFKGIMPALITPINEDGTIKEKTAQELIEWDLKQGVQGFYICGSTGEGPVLGEKTRRQMAEITVETVNGRGAVINHIGAPDTNSALRLARHAAECGCDAISSLVPNFYYTYTEDEVIDYYKRISDVCPLPLIVYVTSLLRSGDVVGFMERIMEEVPTAVGTKFTMLNFYQMHQITELNGGDINVINGPDEMLLCGLSMGADGGIGTTYNVMADWFVELYDRYRSGDFTGAQKVQYQINRVIAVLLKFGCLRSVKETLCLLGFDAGGPAIPGKAIDADTSRKLALALREAGYDLEAKHC